MTISEMKERFNLSEEDVKVLENIELKPKRIMKKIEEIKEKLIGNYWGGTDFLPDYHFNKGFDACMELELPVKFAEWLDENAKDYILSIPELFTHWLENVYKEEAK